MYGAVQCYYWYCRLVLYFEIGGRSTVRTVLYSTTIADWYVLEYSTIKIVLIGVR